MIGIATTIIPVDRSIVLLIVLALLTAVTTYSLVGILAVWGAVGRGHWFLRIAGLLLFLTAWLFAADDRLCLMFLAQSMVVVLRLWFLAGRKSPGEAAGVQARQRHFSLKDLLVGMVLISGVLAMLARLRAGGYAHWWQDILPGMFLGWLTLVALWSAQSKRSVWLRLTVSLITFPGLFMAAWFWLAQRAHGPKERGAAALGLLLIAILPARLYFQQVGMQLRSYPAPLADNGYRDLLRAAESVDESWIDVDKVSDDELREYLVKQNPALDLVGAALARPCQAVLPDGMNDSALQAEYQGMKKIAQLFAARGRLQAKAGQMSAASQSYFTAIHFGAAAAQGGVMMHNGLDWVCEGAGVEGLQQIISRLDDADCRELGLQLAAVEAEREPVEDLMNRERMYIKKEYPWKYRQGAHEANDPLWEAIAGQKRARLRLLICHLALRRLWLATHNYPATLDALVPQYLPAVPLDPFGGEVLIYRKLPMGYQLYSIGFDLNDDGGVPITPVSSTVLPTGDIVIDPAAESVDELPEDGEQ